ncbi:unnamed protein product [Spirodela intermedia]|uniref:Uncharacterized protein n=1 Tax=Spirodela intermedia TaxID=51605 RepID=A0A7I8IJQ5_SPIIN|nr:unnamed protein product [Spirodela intermedia]CAA6658068.1 unnamed protein product [Spirodela intermedia]
MGGAPSKPSPPAESPLPSLPILLRNPKTEGEEPKKSGEEGPRRVEEQLKKKKLWLDEKSGSKEEKNCFTLSARDLKITWGEDPRYWRWSPQRETRPGAGMEVVELLNVCWLEIHGRFEVSHLTPGVTYDVAFLVKMKPSAYGWNAPVNLRLTDAGGRVQGRVERLADKPRGEWLELKAGEIRTVKGSRGEMEVSLFEFEDGAWKSGLIVEGVQIYPKA